MLLDTVASAWNIDNIIGSCNAHAFAGVQPTGTHNDESMNEC